jgi:hypothetical protein
MLLFRGAFGLILLAVWLFCVIDVITTPPERCRNLPKWAWVVIVLLFFEIGAIIWLIAGHTWEPKATVASGARRPARRAAVAPDDDEEYLAGLRARVEEQRRRAREQRRPDEQDPGPVA